MSLPKIKTTEEMPTVPLSRLRKVVEQNKILPDNTRISLEYLLMALFPSVWKNIEKYCSDCYTNGYLQGLEDANKRDN